VARVTADQVKAIVAKVQAGADPKSVDGIPCLTDTITSSRGQIINAAFIVTIAAAAAVTGGAAIGPEHYMLEVLLVQEPELSEPAL